MPLLFNIFYNYVLWKVVKFVQCSGVVMIFQLGGGGGGGGG